MRMANPRSVCESKRKPHNSHVATGDGCGVCEGSQRRDLEHGDSGPCRHPRSEAERERARELASLPLRMGGLGLRSMSRCSRAAYWASWADALPMIQERNPAAMVHNVFPPEGCLSELVQATSQLDQEGFAERPSWSELRRGKRPPTNPSKEPGEWQHGWQHWASSASDRIFRKSTMLSGQSASNRAHLRSHSTPNAGVVFAHAHSSRVRCPSTSVPGVALGEDAPPPADHGGHVRWVLRAT